MTQDPYEKIRLTVFAPAWVRTALKEMLAPTVVSQSQYIAELLEQDLREKGYRPPVEKYSSLADLVKANLDLLVEETEIPKKDLESLAKGNPLKGDEFSEQITLLRIAIALDMSEAEIREIAMPSTKISNKNSKETTNNGI